MLYRSCRVHVAATEIARYCTRDRSVCVRANGVQSHKRVWRLVRKWSAHLKRGPGRLAETRLLCCSPREQNIYVYTPLRGATAAAAAAAYGRPGLTRRRGTAEVAFLAVKPCPPPSRRPSTTSRAAAARPPGARVLFRTTGKDRFSCRPPERGRSFVRSLVRVCVCVCKFLRTSTRTECRTIYDVLYFSIL